MLRAGPFSDERVKRLANRRFVNFFFDLSPFGFAGDREATRFISEIEPSLGRRAVSPPPVMFVTPDGEILDRVGNFCSTEKLFETMLSVLDDYPEYDQPDEDEKKAEGLLEVDILIDRHRLDEAAQRLDSTTWPKDQKERADYMRGRLHRWKGEWSLAQERFGAITKEELLDDVRMERAHLLWEQADFEGLKSHLQDFPEESNRYTEAQYYSGLASYHLGDKEQAREQWSSTIASCSQDPWIYRSDWAYAQSVESERERMQFASSGPRRSRLERIGYMGRINPDLNPRPAKSVKPKSLKTERKVY